MVRLAAITPRLRTMLLVSSLFILSLGALEDVYGNTDSGDIYGSDAVQYLDIARAIGRHDWQSAFNPLWSQGYPAVLAVARPLLPSGPAGDWQTTRIANFAIFVADYLAFLYLLFELIGECEEQEQQRRRTFLLLAGLSLFVATQICLGQVSRVGPDELVTTLFFAACGLIVRLLKRDANQRVPRYAIALGLVLGIGFIAKAVFFALGCIILAVAAIALCKQRRSLMPMLTAAAIFMLIVGGEGIGLSRAAGHPTLGEAGSLNYAWHVNRLQKWVHWQGGNQTAGEAWPKPAVARFAQWTTYPPDFGKPLHPSVVLQQSPLIYGFQAPVHATYVPYFDPPFWYTGYKHIVRPRYQLIALAKSIGDLTQVLLKQPIVYAVALVLLLLLCNRSTRQLFRQHLTQNSALLAVSLLGIAIYLPVHLEGRYLAGFLTIFCMCLLLAASRSMTTSQQRLATVVLLVALAGDLAAYQLPVWRNALHHKSPQKNVEWQVGNAVLAQNFPPMSQAGVIAWTPNLHCDWAYIAHLQITSEIASGQDFNLFWNSSPDAQQQTLHTFQQAGAIAVFAYGKPVNKGGSRWQQLGDTPMWMHRL